MGLLSRLTELLPPYRRDWAYRQALEDQQRADYPGCKEGVMECVALCDCEFSGCRTRKFVRVRAAKLRRNDGSADENPDYGNLQMPVRMRDSA